MSPHGNSAQSREWVLVAGGFHQHGGMDQLNAALANYLLAQNATVHLVGHEIDPEFQRERGARLDRVSRPVRSIWLGQRGLARRGRRAAAAATGRNPAARVLVNGGNCNWADLNWVHFLHCAWRSQLDDGPGWLRLKTQAENARAQRDERRILPRARLLVANSERTRADLIDRLGIDPDRVIRIYPAAKPAPARDARSAAAFRRSLGVADGVPLAAFVGGFASDNRKGFDRLWEAWRILCARPDWSGVLLAAGAGRTLPAWRERIARAGLADRVIFAGFTENVGALLNAADLLVSPTRYEPYGMNVHEALTAGVPAMVSAGAGIAELYPPELRDFLLDQRDDAAALAARLSRWSSSRNAIRERFAAFCKRLAARTPAQMAAEIVAAAEAASVQKTLTRESVRV